MFRASKLCIPPTQAKLVPRPRLTARLNEGVRQKLTLVSAPAGYGKTVLLSEWSRRGERPVAWLSLDEGDNDPLRFWRYATAALTSVGASAGRARPTSQRLARSSSVETLAAALINDVATVPTSLVFVLDDYHVIQAEPVHHSLSFLLDHLPPQMHLVIATRADPPLPVARLRVRGQMNELRAADLRFTLGEMTTLFNRVMGLNLPAGAIRILKIHTEGWIIGLRWVAVSLQGRDNGADFVQALGNSYRCAMDYLAQQVFQGQTDKIRDFLCQTAILDRLTASLCNAVTGRSDSQALLTQLERANLFLIPLDERREWYRYHRLFAHFLRTRTEASSRASLHWSAARWFEANGFTAKAIGHVLAASVESVGA